MSMQLNMNVAPVASTARIAAFVQAASTRSNVDGCTLGHRGSLSTAGRDRRQKWSRLRYNRVINDD
jgi:hypothetical protein